MLVTRSNFEDVIQRFMKPGFYGLDTEATGLRQHDKFFSIILADEDDGYYFNFHPYSWDSSFDREYYLPRRDYLRYFEPVLEVVGSTWFIHNAKYDLGMLANDGLRIDGTVHCTLAIERVLKNNHYGGGKGGPYSLAACAKRRGMAKDESVEAYISKHRLYRNYTVPGKKKKLRDKFFYKVPFDIVAPYGVQDAVLHRAIGMDQLGKLGVMKNQFQGSPDIGQVLAQEKKITKVCFGMERAGIKIDREYVQRALRHEMKCLQEAKDEFREVTGLEFKNDHANFLTKAWDAVGEPYPGKTEQGNPSFAKEHLEFAETGAAKILKKIRQHDKFAGTYYSSFLYFADPRTDLIHANIKQSGTEHGRMSYAEPNLQNVPKEDEPEDFEKPFQVRKSFIPRSEHPFLFIDYDAMEFRMMLDYAAGFGFPGERRLIEAINQGHDPHQATADEAGVSRKEAKTLNFGLLYGMGPEKLGKSLRIETEEAIDVRRRYFSKLPGVKKFLRRVMKTGQARGFVWNHMGRRCHISDPDYAYILANHVVSGGCADVMKKAMIEVDEYLRTMKVGVQMLVQVHDELLFECPVFQNGYHHEYISKIKQIMENAYTPKNGMRLTCSVEHSFKSWGSIDKVKGVPSV